MTDFNEKSRNAYNKKADNYEITFEGNLAGKLKQLLVSTIPLDDNCSVLDVGCGNGLLLSAMKRKQNIKGFGIDISEQMIKNAINNNPDMEFHVTECENIPLGNNSMDIITVCAAYHHFPDVNAFATEAERLLKPEGNLYIAEIYLPEVLRFISNLFIPFSKEGDVKFYSAKEIIETITKRRFKFDKIIKKSFIQIVQFQRL